MKSTTIANEKARYNYFVEDTIECGIVLKGNEVKSIRAGSANFNEAWCSIDGGQLILHNMYIAKYDNANKFDANERRDRVLLVSRKEIAKLAKYCVDRGNTLIPLKLYFSRQYAKIELGLCKGKHNYDKREALKQKDIKRQIERYS